MKPSELTVEVVRAELSSLITRYPDRRGRIVIDGGLDEEDTCVYYTDDKGVHVDFDHFNIEDEEPLLVTPVCIVGQWIEDFHPEFKENDLIRSLLFRNATLRSCSYKRETNPFSVAVCELLATAQDIQDIDDTTWKDIELVLVNRGSWESIMESLETCYGCLCSFSEEEWDQRHSDANGEDVHEECCDICHGDDTEHRIAAMSTI